jgi:hypothetical protein
MFGDIENQNPAVGVVDQAEFNVNMKSFDQTGPGPFRLAKGFGANHLAGPLVGYTQNNLTASLIGQGRAILCQLVKMKAGFSLLEFQVFILVGIY